MKNLSKFIAFLLLTATALYATAADGGKEEKNHSLRVRIQESTWKRDLTDAYCLFYDNEGNVTDSLHTPYYVWNNDTMRSPYIVVPVPTRDSVYVFDVFSPGYETQTVTWDIKGLKKSEVYREMPTIYMKRTRMLKEVTVTGSKVKFYNKGDTIVYDASAFQLAEGSMLDALIAQLPGAKIDENGRITINGEFVESLLLNGKEFFKDNPQLMLENIAAYTVKNIEVYKGQTTREKWDKDPRPGEHLTMDVKLKKEYSIGWIVNAQAGYGTSDRYLGRLLASWFSPRTSIAVVAGANNLNDNRKPGRADTWTPEKMPSGVLRNKNVGINFRHENQASTLSINSQLNAEWTSADYSTSTSQTNFLSGGNTFDRSFNDNRNRSYFLGGNYQMYFRKKSFTSGAYIFANHDRNKNNSNSVAATFNREYADMSRKAIETIYSGAAPGVLESIINRSITRSNGSSRSTRLALMPYASYKFPNSNNALSADLSLRYNTQKSDLWNDYDINFGSDPGAADRRRQYTDNSPNHTFNVSGTLSYNLYMSRYFFMRFGYGYSFSEEKRDSYMFALDRLEDMGVYGLLPDGYAATLDPSNSYTSSTFSNSHSFSPLISWSKNFRASKFSIFAMPNFTLEHKHLDYWRENRSYLVKRTSLLVTNYDYRGLLSYDFTPAKSNPENFTNSLAYELNLRTQTPDLLNLVDVVNDADPLNILEGNPNLHNSFSQNHKLKWVIHPEGKPFNNQLEGSYEVITNDLVRGYVYNTSTGVRRYKSYNVNGNYSFRALDFFNIEFGSKKQFTIASATDYSYANNTDMVGVNLEAPEKYSVRNTTLGEDFIFTYRIGKQELSAQATVSHRHTSSARKDFNNINAQHYKYGVNGVFKLPAGFDISTDFYLYKRVGYGVKELDTTDAVWNLRLTYSPQRHKRWVFIADGFDLLHRLSNVHYAVTATGRTITYTNTLPRYFLLSVQYRLNIQPKK